MNTLMQNWIPQAISHSLGWAIVSSLWHGALILFFYKLLLGLLPRSRSGIRYISGILLLFLFIITVSITFFKEIKSYSHGTLTEKSSIVHDKSTATKTLLNVSRNATPESAPFNIQVAIWNFVNKGLPVVAIMWFCIVGVKSFTLFKGFRRLQYLKNGTSPGKAIASIMQQLTRIMEIERDIQLIVGHLGNIKEPLTFGFIKPVIWLPLSYVTQAPPDQLRLIIAHELAHIKRHDYLVNFFQVLAELLFFFNPFLLSLSRIIRQERECCCDELAAKACGDGDSMAQALINLQSVVVYNKLALYAQASSSLLKERVFRLTNDDHRIVFKTKTFLILSAIVIISAIYIPWGMHRNQSPSADFYESPGTTKQLLADNQAGRKIEFFIYTTVAQKYEMFRVSTIEGTPLYAYLNGLKANAQELARINKLIQNSKQITEGDLNIAQATKGNAIYRSARLNEEIDSLSKQIYSIGKSLKVNPHNLIAKKMLESLKASIDIKAEEYKSVAMEQYKEDIKGIPTSVKLHVLLSSIVKKQTFTADQQKELASLIANRD